MTITEAERFELHQGFIEVLGKERAATIMAMLPPAGWADVATKHDLVALEERIGLRFDARFDRELRELESRFLNRMILVNGAFFGLFTAMQQALA